MQNGSEEQLVGLARMCALALAEGVHMTHRSIK